MKKIIIAVLLISVFIIGVFVFISMQSSEQDLVIENNTSINTSDVSKSLIIDNYNTYKDEVSEADINLFTGSVSDYLTIDKLTKQYNAIIRDGSFTDTTDGDIHSISFIIDIASVKRSYKASIGKDASTGQNTLYTLCVDKSEQVYPDFNCMDDISNV